MPEPAHVRERPASSPPRTRRSASSTNATRFAALPQAEADREHRGRRLALVDGRVAQQPPAALVPVLGRRVGGDVRPGAAPQLAAPQPRDAPVDRDPAAAGRGAQAPRLAGRRRAGRRPRRQSSGSSGLSHASATPATTSRRRRRARRGRSIQLAPPAAASAARTASRPARATVRRLDRRVERAPKQPQPASGAWRSPQTATSAAPPRSSAAAASGHGTARPATTSDADRQLRRGDERPRPRAAARGRRAGGRGRCRGRRRSRRRRPSPARRRPGTARARARGSTRSPAASSRSSFRSLADERGRIGVSGAVESAHRVGRAGDSL